MRASAIAALLLTIAATGDPSAQERPRIAVIPFENETGWWGRDLGNSAASQLTTELVGSGAFVVLERERVQSIYNEWATGQSGAVSAESAVEIGRLLGVEYLVTGQFEHFDIETQSVGIGRIGVGASRTVAESAMNVRVVSVSTGEIVAATTAEGRENIGGSISVRGNEFNSNSRYDPSMADQALGPAIRRIVEQLVAQSDRMPATTGAALAGAPMIAGFSAEGEVYIDQGENVGMTAGRRFRVMRVIDIIVDANGNELDRITDQVGIIEVSRVLSRSAICTLIEGTAEEGDILETVS